MMDENEAAMRELAEAIVGFQAEVQDRVREMIEQDVAEMEATGFDPARGRGRGPWWAGA